MRIIIDKDARDFIREKSSDNSITIVNVRGSCGWASFYIPSVLMGPPRDDKEYKVHEVGNIKVYIDADIRMKGDKFRIRLDKFLWLKQIKAEGIAI